MVGPIRPQFVLFGSSIVQYSFSNGGWGAILADLYSRKADILLRGYAGWNSRRALQVLEQVFPKDATVQPSNMRKIATHLKSLTGNTRIIFLSAPPINEEQIRESLSGIIGELNRTNKLCKMYADACVELCREMDIKVVDLYTSIQKRKDWATTCFTDGIHLSSEGSKVVAEEILKVLKDADWEPSLHWNSLAAEFGEDSPYDLVGIDGKTMNVSDQSFARLMQWGLSNGN
ncbi:hypothetical protein M0R45_028979 [Rubus argutus]|uniref:SGNH hydrolase-type esterase domain-containing protein n=1 Tax=Rubus argutus TaxID=59490 RepID=A0AAW1W6Q6_RUBAR